MNNVDKFNELRLLAIQRGYPREIDKQYYVPIRGRTDGRTYIVANGDHALLFEPEWLKFLVGSELEETHYVQRETLEPLSMPAFEAAMVEMARLRAQKSDVIGYLYQLVKKGEHDG